MIKMPENNSLYQQLFNNSEESQFLLKEGKIVQCNKAAVSLFGYNSREDILGKHPAQLSPGLQPDGTQSLDKAEKEIAKAVKKGSNRFEWVHKKKNGETFPAEVLLTSLKGENDSTVIHAFMHDISKQKKVADELKESEDRFKQLSNLSFEGIILHELGVAIDVNLAIEKISGYTRSEIIGNNVIDLFVPDKYKHLVQEEIVKNKTAPYHIEARHKNGHMIPVEVESRNITINNKKVRVTAIRDLSEKKRHQWELEKSREQYKNAYELFRLMADTTPDMIWAKDMEGNFTFTNKAICENLINAKDVEEPIGKHVMYFVMRERDAHPENKEWFTFGEECGDSDAITIKNRKISRFTEYGNVFGKYLVLDVFKAPLWNEKGEMIGTVGSARDITKQKQAEDELTLSEKRYRMLFENSPDPIVIHNGKIILDVNAATLKLAGKKNKADLVGLDVLSFVHHEDKPKAKIRMEKMLKEKVPLEIEEFRIIDSNNKEMVVIASPAPIDYKGELAFMVTYHDITNRKKAEMEIAEKERQFHTVVESATDAIFLIDYYTTGIILANNQAAMQTGYSIEELLKLTIIDIHPLFKDDNYRNHIREQVLANRSFTFEFDISHKSGHTFPSEVTISFLYYNKRKALLAFVKDITNRKASERALRESQERFKTLSDITFEGILIHEKGIASDLNLSLAEMFGYTKEELLGKNLIELLVARESLSLVYENISKKHAKGYRITGVKKNGTKFPMEIEAKSIVLHNNKTIRVAAFRDISARVKAEEALKSSEEKFKKAFLTSPDAISISELDTGKYVEVNNSFKNILGYTDEEIIGKTSISLNVWKDLSARDKLIAELEQNGIADNMVAEFYTKTGEIKTALLSASIIELSGTPHVLTISRDISDRIVAEEKLKELNRELLKQNNELEKLNDELKNSMNQVSKINRELKVAKQKAEESDQLKSAFLANMSHEIRTPMNGILGFSNLLKNMNITMQERLTYLNIIEQSGKRLLNIINDLIDISKIESGQMKVKKTNCDIKKQLVSIHTFFSQEAKQKHLQLILQNNAKKEPLTLFTDEDKFLAIITNLIKNAIKYTKEGSIVIGYRRKDELIEFFVKDTGIGIAKDRQKAIFERFIQADIKDRDAYEGAGLGLAITKAYVDMLGGTIRVESEEGKGSTFYFTLPNDYPEKTIQAKSSYLTKTDNMDSIPKLNILIAEDEPFSDQLLTVVLNKIANKIHHVQSGLQAVEVFSKHPEIDLIMMDIKMRDMDGYKAATKIRALSKDVVIIAQTAYAMAGDREKALKAGCNDYLAKPIIKDKVLEIVGKYFSL